MEIMKRFGYMPVNEHKRLLQDAVDRMNVALGQETYRRTMLVDETINSIARWQMNVSEIMNHEQTVRVSLDVPSSLLIGLVQDDPEISGFVIHRMTHLLQKEVQAAINAILAQRMEGQYP